MAPIQDGSKDMPADCKPYYYIGISGNVKENLRFSVP